MGQGLLMRRGVRRRGEVLCFFASSPHASKSPVLFISLAKGDVDQINDVPACSSPVDPYVDGLLRKIVAAPMSAIATDAQNKLIARVGRKANQCVAHYARARRNA